MSHPSIIAPATSCEESASTITPENACSRLPLDRHVGAFLSLAELRRQYVVNVAVTVSHIRQIVALEDAR